MTSCHAPIRSASPVTPASPTSWLHERKFTYSIRRGLLPTIRHRMSTLLRHLALLHLLHLVLLHTSPGRRQAHGVTRATGHSREENLEPKWLRLHLCRFTCTIIWEAEWQSQPETLGCDLPGAGSPCTLYLYFPRFMTQATSLRANNNDTSQVLERLWLEKFHRKRQTKRNSSSLFQRAHIKSLLPTF